MIYSIVFLSALGITISLYGIIVEYRLKHNQSYRAACDINNMVSCSKAFSSQYNALLGISNIYACLLYYCAMLCLGLYNYLCLAMMLSWLGLLVTVYFAYILYGKIKTICLICTSLYVINLLLVFFYYV